MQYNKCTYTPPISILGHNSFLKQLIKVVLILNKSLLVHFEKLRSSLFFFLSFFSYLRLTFFFFFKCWKPPQHRADHNQFFFFFCHGTHSDNVTEQSKRSRRMHLKCNETTKKQNKTTKKKGKISGGGQNVHRLKRRGEGEKKIKRNK